MKANAIAAVVGTLIISVSAAPAVDKRDLPLLGGNSGLLQPVGTLLNKVEGHARGLGGAGGAVPALPVAGGAVPALPIAGGGVPALPVAGGAGSLLSGL